MGKITNRIRRLRFEQSEMTQDELAKRAGCTRQTIIALEQDKYVPSIELAYRVAKALATPIEAVFLHEE
ncbi:MAG: helix-turn-helix transcriptional regulator [Dehalogenimonas sp.]|uniref:Helix-turn-helix transcriptional regulator n=1 Tax=Candidatus Dehalogenimonas loeffleri TaxID=3127115 RepID=A0ABZ2J9U1_9CHLR|nr:helix-turn-helix transcriptional regulator [Dehalogenimonas sp.]